MKRQIYLVYLDGYHLGDPVFLDDLARSASSSSGQLPPILFFHGSGEKAERTLEGAGHFLDRKDGVLDVETAEHERLVERATRESNKEIVEKMTDQQLSVVGIQGVDRSFFTYTDSEVETGSIGWLNDLLQMRVIPVVSGLAQVDGRTKEIPPARALLALRDHFHSETTDVNVIVMAKRMPEKKEATNRQASVRLEEVYDEVYTEPQLIRHLVDGGVQVSLATPSTLFRQPPEHLRIRKSGSTG